jgi:hypothetical protein
VRACMTIALAGVGRALAFLGDHAPIYG